MDRVILKNNIEVADGILGKKVANVARNISNNALCLIERRGDWLKNYLNDKSYEIRGM